MTTRLGFSIILAGIALLILRATGVVNSELADIAATLALVAGALAVAIDGESPEP